VPLTPTQYLAEYTPRFPGLLHTAPAYDEITKPSDAPVIAGCVERKKTGDCKCYDQQGNTYKTTAQICASYLQDGMFIAWRKPETQRAEAPEKPQSQERPQVVQVQATPFRYGSQVEDLPGGSHNFAGGLSEAPKKQSDAFTIKPAG
jgi:zona occludens toxin